MPGRHVHATRDLPAVSVTRSSRPASSGATRSPSPSSQHSQLGNSAKLSSHRRRLHEAGIDVRPHESYLASSTSQSLGASVITPDFFEMRARPSSALSAISRASRQENWAKLGASFAAPVQRAIAAWETPCRSHRQRHLAYSCGECAVVTEELDWFDRHRKALADQSAARPTLAQLEREIQLCGPATRAPSVHSLQLLPSNSPLRRRTQLEEEAERLLHAQAAKLQDEKCNMTLRQLLHLSDPLLNRLAAAVLPLEQIAAAFDSAPGGSRQVGRDTEVSPELWEAVIRPRQFALSNPELKACAQELSRHGFISLSETFAALHLLARLPTDSRAPLHLFFLAQCWVAHRVSREEAIKISKVELQTLLDVYSGLSHVVPRDSATLLAIEDLREMLLDSTIWGVRAVRRGGDTAPLLKWIFALRTRYPRLYAVFLPEFDFPHAPPLPLDTDADPDDEP